MPPKAFDESVFATIGESLRARLGPGVEIVFEKVDRIPRTSAGKFRSVISNISSSRTQ